MKKVLFCSLVIFFSLTLFSCALLSDHYTIKNKNEKIKFPANVQIYIYNRTIENESINVFISGNILPLILLETILQGDEKMINIEKGTKIYINSANTGRLYKEIICDKDREKYYIYY
jgi:hypothetical protein